MYDHKLHNNKLDHIWLYSLSGSAEQAIADCLLRLKIPKEEQVQFLTLMLTTLPGWAAYIKYCAESNDIDHKLHPVTQVDYLAVRLIITCLIWSEARRLLNWHNQAIKKSKFNSFDKIQAAELQYRSSLLEKIAAQARALC